MGGITYLEFIRTLTKRVDTEWDSVKADLHTIRSALLARWARGGRQGAPPSLRCPMGSAGCLCCLKAPT